MINYQAFMDGLTSHVALVDETGDVVAVNAAWRQFAHKNGSTMRHEGVGINYYRMSAPCWPEPVSEQGDPQGWAVAEGLHDVIQGKVPLFTMEYPCHGPSEKRWFRVIISPVPSIEPKRFIVAHENISELVAARNKTQETYLGAISSFVAALEQRDPYTSGHQDRVTELALLIGKELGLSKNALEGLRLGAIVHDIGKLSVPAEILTYPGKLDKSRFSIIQEHPVVGKQILERIDFPWPVVAMVYQHHERIDGSGYPLGLSGDDIIIEARILAVADVVEAISSHRPYRPALGLDTAIDELQKLRGIKYDETVVAAFLKVAEEQPELIANIVAHHPN